jgi:DNA ligase-1
MNLDPLYKRTKTGAIQYWKIRVETSDTGGGEIIKESGQYGTTSPLTHREVVEKGKQKRTAKEQALSQAQSDWKKKRDEGYKTLTDLNIQPLKNDGYCWTRKLGSNDKEVPYYGTLADVLDQAMPQFNTDASGNVKPMLAPTKPWKHGDKKNKYPRTIEPKLDGVRSTIVINKNGLQGTIEVLSRSGKPYSNMTHLVDGIKESILEFSEGTTILDGELYYHGWLLEEINQAVKKYNPETTPLIQFWMYDVPLYGGDQTERNAEVLRYWNVLDPKKFKALSGIKVENDDEVLKLHDHWAGDGYEGAMLKDMEGVYEQGQRSRYWTKVKMFDDTEFEIVGHTLGQRGVEDLMFVCKCEGGTFEAKMKGSTATKQLLFDRIDTLIGKQLTVKHFGYSKYNIPNLPIGKAIREE